MVDNLQRDDGVRSMSDLSHWKGKSQTCLTMILISNENKVWSQQNKNKHIANLTSCRTNNKSLHIQSCPEGISLSEHIHNISSSRLIITQETNEYCKCQWMSTSLPWEARQFDSLQDAKKVWWRVQCSENHNIPGANKFIHLGATLARVDGTSVLKSKKAILKGFNSLKKKWREKELPVRMQTRTLFLKAIQSVMRQKMNMIHLSDGDWKLSYYKLHNLGLLT